MAAKTCPTAGKSSVQAVFVEIEDVSGELQRPTADGYIVPRGNASMNQTPGQSESEELSESLNTLDLFQNAVEAGEASIPMYLRIDKTNGKPQGHALFLAGMGNYDDVTKTYTQDICRNTISIWMKNDHMVTFGSGGVVTQMDVALSNEGGQNIDFTVQFRKMGWAGKSYISAVSSDTFTVVTKDNENAAQAYSVGAIVKTADDDNSGAGYTVTAVDNDNGTITVSPTPSSWAVDDMIEPWLPDAEPIGDAIESRDARIEVSGKTGKVREGSLSVGTPTEFLREIGDAYPGESVDTKREISITMNGYMRADDARELGRGYESYEVPITLTLGKTTGQKMAFSMPRVKMTMPEIGTDGAAFTLDRTGTALGVKGEDALTIQVK